MVADKENLSTFPKRIQSRFEYVSIIDTIKSLFLREDFVRAFEKSVNAPSHSCKEKEYHRFCCSDRFKNNEFFQKHPHSLQIQIATDEFEVCNALGSKATLHKCCAIYFVFPNMPRTSNLKNIYLVCLCNGNDLKTKQTDFNDLWKVIVKEIKYLEEFGINVNDNLNVKCTLVNVSFDNLGANQSLGVAEGFNSNYYCRICECSKEDCQTEYREIECKIRSKKNYVKQLAEIEMSANVDLSETRGIKRSCALNELKYLHIFDNPSVDIMHDLNEGVSPYTLKHLFKYCNSEKIVKEIDLKKMIQYHDFGILNRKNMPSLINMDKHNLNQNASQSLCLFRQIPFILAPFREQLQDVWICIETLLKIVQIVYSLKITDHDLRALEQYVFEHLSCVKQKLKIRDNLLPKHHFTTQYARIIREMGPLKQMSMIRFESKHKTLKSFVKKTHNFMNVNKTLAIKHQKMMSKCKNSYDNQIGCGKKTELLDISGLQSIISVSESDLIYSVKWLQYNNYRYRPGLLILHDKFLFEIDRILIVNDEYHILCFQYEKVNFDSFLNSFKIKKTEPQRNLSVKFGSLQKKELYEKKKLNDDFYVLADTLDLFWSIN